MKKQHKRAMESYALFAGADAAYQSGGATRDMVVVNKVKGYVDAVHGFMLQNRRRAKYLATIEDSEEQQIYSGFLNDFRKDIRDNANSDQIESLQNKGMLIAGYGAIETGLVFGDDGATRDPNGEYIQDAVPYDKVFWDRSAVSPNLLDARYIWRDKTYNMREALDRFKGSDQSDFTTIDNQEGAYQYAPLGGTYDRQAENTDPYSSDVVVHNYQWWEREKYYRAINPVFDLMQANPELAMNAMQGMQIVKQQMIARTEKAEQPDMFTFNPEAPILVMNQKIYSKLKPLFVNAGIQLEEDEGYRKCFYTSLMSDTVIFDKFKNLDQQGFSIKFKTADYDHINECWFGMLDVMKTPLLYSNKVLTELLRIISSNSKGGIIYEKGVTDNPMKLEQSWANPSASVEVNEGKMDRIKPKTEPYTPTGYDRLLPIFDSYIELTSPVDKNFLGSSENRQETAALQRQRIKQVTSVLAAYFDSITLYDKEQARMDMTYMRELAEINPSRAFRTTNDDGAIEIMRADPSYFVDEYDIEIDEAPTSATEQEEKAQVALSLAQQAAMIGKDLYPQAIKMLPYFTQQEKQEWIEAMSPKELSPEEQQAQAEQRQLALVQAQLQLEKMRSEVSNKDADTLVKETSAEKNQAETDKTVLETELAASQPINDFNVNL
ncbi:MAG: hypothetical protein VW683_06805 [Betaproteobacteria bacterium]